jgi:hypothetical protein
VYSVISYDSWALQYTLPRANKWKLRGRRARVCGGEGVPCRGVEGQRVLTHINKEEDGVPIGMREEQEKTVIVSPSPIICESS